MTTTTLRPWGSNDVRLLIVGDALATLLLVISAVASGRVSTLNDAIVWANLAVIALVAFAANHGTFLLIGRKRVGARRRALLPDASTDLRHATGTSHDERWVWIAGTRRAHRPNCPLATGKHATLATDALIRAEQLERCEVCGS